jgi:hypothetical protein
MSFRLVIVRTFLLIDVVGAKTYKDVERNMARACYSMSL